MRFDPCPQKCQDKPPAIGMHARNGYAVFGENGIDFVLSNGIVEHLPDRTSGGLRMPISGQRGECRNKR